MVEPKVAESFKKISRILDARRKRLGVGFENEKNLTIVLAGVSGNILQKLLYWAEKHQDDQYFGSGRGTYRNWDKAFFRVNRSMIEEISAVADEWGLTLFTTLAKVAIGQILQDSERISTNGRFQFSARLQIPQIIVSSPPYVESTTTMKKRKFPFARRKHNQGQVQG